ncbi:MAG: hypothetical protein WCF18_12260, partial [Chthoniobacteraceae bacterium]
PIATSPDLPAHRMNLPQKPLLVLATFGFVVPNGVFLYHAFRDPTALRAALANPVALVFIGEAFLLTAFFAWWIQRCQFRSPGWFAFVIMSFVGSLAFSIPAFLYLVQRRSGKCGGPSPFDE